MDVERYQWPEPDKWQAMLDRRQRMGLKPVYKDEPEFEAQLVKVLARLQASTNPGAASGFAGLPPSVIAPAKPLAKLPHATGIHATPSATPSATPWKPLPQGPYAPLIQLKGAPGKLVLTPAEAAERFLSWLRATGHMGQFFSDDLRGLYRNHCIDQGLAWAPENWLREALSQLPGVSRTQTYQRVKGQRVRPVVWEIREDPSPMRRAA